MHSNATLLSEQDVTLVHAKSLEILERIGLLVHNEKARMIFSQHGCTVQPGSSLIKFPPSTVEKYRKLIPPTFTFHARDPQFDRTIPADRPVIVTASSAPGLIDPISGDERRSTSDDIGRIAYLIDQLPGYDIFSISTLAEDALDDQFTISRLFPSLKYCRKPIRSTTTDAADAKKVLDLAVIIAGSLEAYKERPFITHHFCPLVSPLTMDFQSTEMLIHFTKQGLPVYPSIVPNGGLTSPMTLEGTLVQANAEFLATAILMQMVVPQTPLIYSTLPTIADLRMGAYASGGIESGMLHMACAQMAGFYDLPSGGYIGLTNSKINDSQAGYETGLSSMASTLGGADMLNMGGLLDALKAFDYPKTVIDGEIALMLKRVVRGMQFNEDNLALDVLEKVGPGGSFMSERHTIKFMRKAAIVPQIADRDSRGNWESSGRLDAHARAWRMTMQILSGEVQSLLPAQIEQIIRDRFPGLVSGDLLVPDDWKNGIEI